jgi:hypothetical protein
VDEIAERAATLVLERRDVWSAQSELQSMTEAAELFR